MHAQIAKLLSKSIMVNLITLTVCVCVQIHFGAWTQTFDIFYDWWVSYQGNQELRCLSRRMSIRTWGCGIFHLIPHNQRLDICPSSDMHTRTGPLSNRQEDIPILQNDDFRTNVASTSESAHLDGIARLKITICIEVCSKVMRCSIKKGLFRCAYFFTCSLFWCCHYYFGLYRHIMSVLLVLLNHHSLTTGSMLVNVCSRSNSPQRSVDSSASGSSSRSGGVVDYPHLHASALSSKHSSIPSSVSPVVIADTAISGCPNM